MLLSELLTPNPFLAREGLGGCNALTMLFLKADDTQAVGW